MTTTERIEATIAVLLVCVPPLLFGLVSVGLPLPLADPGVVLVVRTTVGLLALIWVPFAALIAGWLTGRWKVALLVFVPLVVVRGATGAGLYLLGPLPRLSELTQLEQVLGFLTTTALSFAMVIAADLFWSVVCAMAGASNLLHAPGWVRRSLGNAALAVGTVVFAYLAAPVLFELVDAGIRYAELDPPPPRNTNAPTSASIQAGLAAYAKQAALPTGLRLSTVVPSLASFFVVPALARRALGVPLALAHGSMVAAVTLFGGDTATQRMGMEIARHEVLLMNGTVALFIGLLAFACTLPPAMLGTAVGRMARGERLFGRRTDAEDEHGSTPG